MFPPQRFANVCFFDCGSLATPSGAHSSASLPRQGSYAQLGGYVKRAKRILNFPLPSLL